jgi:hypothetical protein
MFRIHQFFLHLCIDTYCLCRVIYSDGMDYLVADGANSLRQWHVQGCPRTFNPLSRGIPPSPPMPLVSLEQLLASQNDIMQRLAEIDER